MYFLRFFLLCQLFQGAGGHPAEWGLGVLPPRPGDEVDAKSEAYFATLPGGSKSPASGPAAPPAQGQVGQGAKGKLGN